MTVLRIKILISGKICSLLIYFFCIAGERASLDLLGEYKQLNKEAVEFLL